MQGIRQRYVYTALAGLMALVAAAGSINAQAPTRFRLGYFEAGEDPLNYVFRDELQRLLTNLSPTDTEFVFVPEGYRSASWIRDSSRIMARELVGMETVDIVVAIGPWVVEDLLEAGFAKPIVGIRQIDPRNAGLLTPSGKPKVRNLTLHDMPNKIEDDISVLAQLAPIKKLGVLWFDTGTPETDSIIARVSRVAEQLGVTTATAEFSNVHGTYAFFRSFQNLPTDIDGLYVGPLWGLNITEVNEFLRMVSDRRIPLMTWEGKFLVARGAFATNYAYGLVSEAYFQALKLLRIAQGEAPAELPVRYRGGTSLAINAATAAKIGVDVPAEALLSGEVVGMVQPEGAEWYTLVDAVTRAINGNPSFLATYDAIEAAAREAKGVASEYWPQIALEGAAGWIDDHTINNTVEPLQNEQYRASFVLDQRIFSLESLRSRKVTAAQTRVAEVAQRQARLDLELAVTTAYLGHLRAREELSVEQRYRELVERTLEFAASRYYLLTEGEADIVRWQDERQTVIARVFDADNTATTTRVLLNLLFNLPPERPVTLDPAVASDRLIALDYELLAPLSVKPERRLDFEAFLVEQARTASPSLARESARLSIEQARLSAAGGRYWPSVDLRAAFNLADEIDDDLGVIDERTDTWSIFGHVRLPLFLGGQRGHERARLKAGISEIEYYRDAALLELMADVRGETGQLVTKVASLPRYGRASELALQSMQVVIGDYEGGRRDMTGVIEAYRHARDMELTAIGSRYEYLLTMAQLVHDVGWSPSGNLRNFYEEFHRQTREPLTR